MALCLEKSEYEVIEERLVLSNPDIPSATRQMTAESTAIDIPPTDTRNDFSLTRQLNELTLSEQDRPDAYYFTVRSAVPIADAVRGYYSARHLDLPSLRPVYANWRFSRSGLASKEATEEEERLRQEVADVQHAAVIDQYVATGTTITYASQLLLRSGVPRVTAIPGHWYDDIYFGHEHVATMTSQHCDFLFRAGQACAQAQGERSGAEKARKPYRPVQVLRPVY